ncbi:MAG: hypothetical protein HUK21_03230 [Fibrobacteraceae bacterium]|nr:hypothetical protein [Fibrobacteraceae bacterium]
MLNKKKLKAELEKAGHKIVANTMTPEELLKLENETVNADERSGAFEFDGSWEKTVAEIKARKAKNATKMRSFRIPVWIIEGLEKNAKKGGVNVSEYAIALLAKGAL